MPMGWSCISNGLLALRHRMSAITRVSRRKEAPVHQFRIAELRPRLSDAVAFPVPSRASRARVVTCATGCAAGYRVQMRIRLLRDVLDNDWPREHAASAAGYDPTLGALPMLPEFSPRS